MKSDLAAPPAPAATNLLALRAAAGDQEAFTALVERLAPALHRYLVTTGATVADADDLVQEAFIRAHAALPGFDPRYAFTTWLYTIAHRLRLNRVARARVSVPLEAVPEPAQAEQEPAEERPEAATDLWATARRLLPARQAEALWLRYGEDLAIPDIARILDLTGVHVRVLLHRARARLARHLRPSAEEP